jgi:hypothetical protein
VAKFRNVTVSDGEAPKQEWASCKADQRCQGPPAGWTKNRHFSVGSSRNIPGASSPELAVLPPNFAIAANA